jgi:hypothetical protein
MPQEQNKYDGAAAPKAADATTQPPPAQATTDGGTGFRPVTGAEEMQSGGRLLVEAYAAIWLIVLGLVFLMWRRTRALEERITVLDGAVSRAEAVVLKAKSEGVKSAAKVAPKKKKPEPADDEPDEARAVSSKETGD